MLALVLVMAGCTTTTTGPDGAARSVVVPSGADSIAEVLGCALVGPASVDQPGWSGPSALEQWLEDDSFDEANDRSLWLLFTTSGRGYGVAVAKPTNEGQWSAQVDQWCADTAPLPLATNATPAPSTTPAFKVPPIPGPDSQTLALATFDQTAGISSTSGIFALNPTEAFVVQTQCLATASGVTLGYTVLVDEEAVSSGRIPCDGGIYRDSALAGTGRQTQCTVQLAVGTDVVRAYAALVPQ
ncbi:MAG: hypothetical protein MUF09_09280 [Candidatus Nanopelagicales bacterium]|nr:hypothetical protein [Candidatus Nanopelagicales bacterium]